LPVLNCRIIAWIKAKQIKRTALAQLVALRRQEESPHYHVHGGWLNIAANTSYLDHEYAACHVEVEAGLYVEIAISDTGQGTPPACARGA
jgi:hypothetical protein